MAQVTHFFAGANSGDGFQNLFSEIVDLEDTYDLMVLKGGPGGQGHLHAGDRPKHGGGRHTGGVLMVFRRPGFPGRRGAAGAPLRRGGWYVASCGGAPVPCGGGPVCGPGAVLRPHRRQGRGRGGEGSYPGLQGRIYPGLSPSEGWPGRWSWMQWRRCGRPSTGRRRTAGRRAFSHGGCAAGAVRRGRPPAASWAVLPTRGTSGGLTVWTPCAPRSMSWRTAGSWQGRCLPGASGGGG